MAKRFKPVGVVTVEVEGDVRNAAVGDVSVGAASGPLGSVVHGLRIEIGLMLESNSSVTIEMGAADALQFAEEIRAAVHRREDVKRT